MSEALFRAALTGTQRAAELAVPEELSRLVPQGASAEERLLLLAGAMAARRRAGLLTEPREQPPRAPEEPQPACSAQTAQLLRELLAQGKDELLREAAALLAQHGLRLRPELLPAVLELTSAKLRAALRPVLGARGPWLAAQHAGWTWARTQLPAALDEPWDELPFAERLARLRAARALDPARARALLEPGWKTDSADHRAQRLELFRLNLQPADEAFLEAALDDRAQAVRAGAARLLALLPGSALSRRMLERAQGLLAFTQAPPADLLSKLKSLVTQHEPVLEVTLPGELDAAWERDGVPRKPPAGQGARAHWLSRTLALIPPAQWPVLAGQRSLPRAAAAHEDALALLLGLTDAVVLFGAREEAAQVWDAVSAAKLEGAALLESQMLQALAPLLPDALAPERLLASLRDTGDLAPLAALPTPWPQAFAAPFVAALQKGVAGADEALFPLLPLLALGLPAASLAALFEAPPMPPATLDGFVGARWRTALETLAGTLHQRKVFYESVQSSQERSTP